MKNSQQFPTWEEMDKPVSFFLILTPLIGVIGTIAAISIEGWSWSMFFFTLFFAAATNLSITTGYHRLWAHRSFEAHPLVQMVLLFISTSAWQSSVFKWVSDHRVHHHEIDTEEDPYNIHRGFWFAHLGWMMFKNPADYKVHCPDLEKNYWLSLQHRYYIPAAIFAGFLFPLFVGWCLGFPLTGLFMAGALRIGLTQQSTFFVNSLCHTLGKQTYCRMISARDSFFVALVTFGEGYHNFHHRFQIDYRNGVRWYHWDPTKWIIQLLALVGLAKKLRTAPAVEILKARLQQDSLLMQKLGLSAELWEPLKEQVLSAQLKLRQLQDSYHRAKSQGGPRLREQLHLLQTDLNMAKIEFRAGLKKWRLLLRAYSERQLMMN